MSKLMEDLILRERAETRKENAQEMLAVGLSPDIVSRCSGLTLDEVKQLQSKKNA